MRPFRLSPLFAATLLLFTLTFYPLPARAQTAGTFGTPYQRTTATKTADYTLVAADDVVPLSHATTVLTATLHTPTGYYPTWQGGRHRIINNSSTQIVLIAAASGTIKGPSMLYPGQIASFESDGIGTWYSATPQATGGIVNVSLSSAQILALNATPVSLVPAPGAGKSVIVESISLKMTTTATQYANGGALEFRYTDASGAKVSADLAAAIVTAAAATSYTSVAGVTTSLTGVVNAAVVVDNATAAFITGTGTGVVSVKYRVVPYA